MHLTGAKICQLTETIERIVRGSKLFRSKDYTFHLFWTRVDTVNLLALTCFQMQILTLRYPLKVPKVFLAFENTLKHFSNDTGLRFKYHFVLWICRNRAQKSQLHHRWTYEHNVHSEFVPKGETVWSAWCLFYDWR